MPRIPVRTTPYHTLPRCTRHYKSKRDLILRALGKASFINGSQFVIAWISPKGEVDTYASELLQTSIKNKEGGVLNRRELDKEAARIKGEMGKRWESIRRLEEKGEAPVLEEDAEEDADEEDGDKTLVDDDSAGGPMSVVDTELKKSMTSMMSTIASTPTPVSQADSARPSTPPPMHTLNLTPESIETYYNSRFATLQQTTCKLVVKAWIKVIEPKKQMKYPYNKGEEVKPAWWPEGVRHREPDHLSKTERLTLLTHIVRSPLINVARLELATAEAAAFISRPRLEVLREVYLVAKEEERKRHAGDTSPLIVHLPNVPVSPSAISPENTGEYLKRLRSDGEIDSSDSGSSIVKRSKPSHPAAARLGLAPLMTHAAYYDPSQLQQPTPQFAYSQWRDPTQPAHLSPYPSEMGYSGSEYGRSPNPDQMAGPAEVRPYHLAPILNHHHSHSPAPSPAFNANPQLAPPPHSATSQPPSAYYPRSQGPSYMQQQQLEYLQSHSQYEYGSPYIAEPTWDGQFAPSNTGDIRV